MRGRAQFTLAVDGQQLGGGLSTAASHALGQTQTINLLGDFVPGQHTLSVSFLNDRYDGPGLDRNLYVAGATLNGAPVAGSALTLLSDGTQNVSFLVPLPTG